LLTSKQIKLLTSLKIRKFREKHRKFLIEGFHLVKECLESSFTIERLVLRRGVNLNLTGIENLSGVPIDFVPSATFKRLSETVNSPGVIGVVNMPAEASKVEGNLLLALEGISDPGNLGTILRTAYWFDVRTVILTKDSVDLFNSKVIRSSQGSLFHIGVKRVAELTPELEKLKENGFEVVLFSPRANLFLNDLSQPGKYVAVLGNESKGISRELLEGNFSVVSIRGFSRCESLNVSVSCGIILNHLKQLTPP